MTTQEVDFDALERDLLERLAAARQRRQELALDVLSDPAGRQELGQVEDVIAECEHEQQRLALARAELERRELARREKEESEARRAAYREAQLLQSARERAAEAIDRAATAFVAAIVAYGDVCVRQQTALRSAGRPQQAHIARPFRFGIEATFARAMSEARGKRQLVDVWERLPLIPPMHQKPLAEADARPVEPINEKEA